jgi:lactobin A/cerein 7B family class IIb bacteriocin
MPKSLDRVSINNKNSNIMETIKFRELTVEELSNINGGLVEITPKMIIDMLLHPFTAWL